MTRIGTMIKSKLEECEKHLSLNQNGQSQRLVELDTEREKNKILVSQVNKCLMEKYLSSNKSSPLEQFTQANDVEPKSLSEANQMLITQKQSNQYASNELSNCQKYLSQKNEVVINQPEINTSEVSLRANR